MILVQWNKQNVNDEPSYMFILARNKTNIPEGYDVDNCYYYKERNWYPKTTWCIELKEY